MNSGPMKLEFICGDSIFWDHNLTWNTNVPKLTRCFHNTVLNWIPTCFLWLLAIYEINRTAKIRRKLIPWNWINTSRLIFSILSVIVNCLQLVNTFYHYFNSQDSSIPSEFYSSSFNIVSFLLLTLLFDYHRVRGVHSSAIIWLYLFLQTICTLLISYSTWIDSSEYSEWEIILVNSFFVSNVFLLIITSFADVPTKLIDEHEALIEDEDGVVNRKISPENVSSFPNSIVFWWFNQMAMLGYRKSLTIKDLWELRDDLKTENLVKPFDDRLQQMINRQVQSSRETSSNRNQETNTKVKVNIIPILFKIFGGYYSIGSLLKFTYDLLQFVIPQLSKLLITFIENHEKEPVWHGFIIAFSMFIVSCIQTITFNHYRYRLFITQMRVTSTLTSTIYKKSLNLSDKARKQINSGEVVNLMAIDASRFDGIISEINWVWSAPFQIIVATWFLYRELGYSSFFGLGVMIAMIPFNFGTVRWSQKFQKNFMKRKDERVKFINEILNGIKIIKFYAWEDSFLKIVNDLRKRELIHLKKLGYFEFFLNFLWSCSPTMVSVATFSAHVLVQGETLTAQKAFVSLSLFHILQFPMSMLPELFSYYISASTSVERINKFLSYKDLDPYVTRYEDVDVISVKDGSFKWNKKMVDEDNPARNSSIESSVDKKVEDSTLIDATLTLKDINMHVAPGSFVAIVGPVGSGKSSLLSAILGEMEKISGQININGKYSIAYVAQQAWIQNTSLKNNILFGSPFDPSKYHSVISACALEPDIAYLPGGDETEIGEKGINLSGGQKQRVSLARACYSDSNLFIFDDPLSAVDAHVAQHIFKKVLSSKTGLLRNKTRVLVTNKLDILSKVDSICVLTNGKITENGTYEELMAARGEFANLVKQFTNLSAQKQNHEDWVIEQIEKKKSIRLKNRIQDDNKKLIETEDSETGKVKWSVYSQYFGMVSILWTIIMVSSQAIANGFQLGSDVWLAKWSSDDARNVSLSYTEMRLGVYSALGLSKAIVTLFGSWALLNGTLRASIGFHRNLSLQVFRSPMSFFDTNPIGRILNRFSQDIDTIDTTLRISIGYWLMHFFEVLAACVIICINTPLFMVTLFPVSFIYFFIQRVYVSASRQLKRLESVTRSPIYSHFSETLNGVTTIRAFGLTERFIKESAEKVDSKQSCKHPIVVGSRWLSIRLEFCSNLLILSTAIFAVLSRGSLDPGTVGLVITYATSVTLTINWFVMITSNLETNIVAVERISEYCKLPSEADWYKGKVSVSDDWPSKGSIKFDNYETRYREGTELVLRGISCEINELEKIGIVGRTGAGKSTVTLSLFRLIEGSGGCIYIDGVNISDLPLHPLRSRLAIIPQDPVLFGGTLRFNLDPFDCYTDNDIWDSLSHAHLKQFVNNTGQGLNYQIAEEGKNLSVGQRQLLCLARALLKKPKILFLDEATAAIDLETDSLIQKTIRTQFKNCTILTIAHRLNTIMDSDRVLVLDRGLIAEFDTPKNLLENKKSIFYSLAKEANLVSG